ncbi:MAG: c-type cytochrome [Caldilineaceae bacterium]|nr:c-type cytochrome [Caldilineaceae bacterium]
MSDPLKSARQNKARNRARVRRASTRGELGCVVVFLLLVAGLAAAGIIGLPRVVDSLTGQTAATLTTLDDRTSPEELAARRARELAQLNGYGWVDRTAGVARIPIDRAIALVAEAGLPVGQTPVAAPSPEGVQPAASEPEEQATEAPATPAIDLANVNYEDHVLPIFEQHCAECHGDEKAEEGLKLITYRSALAGSQYGPVLVPGDPDNSYLVEMVVSGKMPKRGDPLTPEEIEIIIAWIRAGAPEQGTPSGEATPAPAETPDALPEESTPAVDLANVSFQNHVLPIFEQHCAECHGDEKAEEGLKLIRYNTALAGSQYGPVIVPGDPDNSYLVEMIVSGKMPKRGDPLSPAEIEIITAWIAAGAPDN